MLTPGWWVALDGEVTHLRDLVIHFDEPALRVVEWDGGFYLGSLEFDAVRDADGVRTHGVEPLALACGAVEIELGEFRKPHVAAAVRVTDDGEIERLTPVGASMCMQFDIHQDLERVRTDGMIEVVEIAPPLPRAKEWLALARTNRDVGEALAVLARENARWHDLYFIFELVERNVGRRMFDDGWTTKAAAERFTQTANSRHAIGREARHAKDKISPPKG